MAGRYWNKPLRALLTWLSLLLLVGCAPKWAGVLPGETKDLDGTFRLWIGYRTQDAFYYATNLAPVAEELPAEPAWILDDGLLLVDSSIEVAPKKLHFVENNYRIFRPIDGLEIRVHARLAVAEDAEAGRKSVSLRLPALGAMGASTPPVFEKGYFESPDLLHLARVTVRTSAQARDAVGFGVPAAVLILLGAAWVWRRR